MTFFETSSAEREDSSGSMSIHFLSFIGTVLGNSTVSLFCGLRMRNVLTQRPDSDFNSMFSVHVTGRDFQYGSISRVSLNPSFWL